MLADRQGSMEGDHKAAEGAPEVVEHLEATGGRRSAPVTGQTLREHFHLPLHTVAQKFGMCTTAFKKMCRRLGIAKWPHRQVDLGRRGPCQSNASRLPMPTEHALLVY